MLSPVSHEPLRLLSACYELTAFDSILLRGPRIVCYLYSSCAGGRIVVYIDVGTLLEAVMRRSLLRVAEEVVDVGETVGHS